ncbi:hypothetical protein AVEN_95531-1 [Araneus ventricosus]|uniref:Uncharacterized protein n=1 Tax=Araneus ventricosus TaxID=182803 RepID=A0A4Y2HEK1_ARAVE|nr:hypothetical protein AVEN_95531-1 [Araneus ventricosus]
MQGARQAFMLLWGWEREGPEKKDQWLDDQRSKLPETAPARFRWSHAFLTADGEPARLPSHVEKKRQIGRQLRPFQSQREQVEKENAECYLLFFARRLL